MILLIWSRVFSNTSTFFQWITSIASQTISCLIIPSIALVTHSFTFISFFYSPERTIRTRTCLGIVLLRLFSNTWALFLGISSITSQAFSCVLIPGVTKVTNSLTGSIFGNRSWRAFCVCIWRNHNWDPIIINNTISLL